MPDNLRTELDKKQAGLKNERSNWEGDWTQIQSHFMPFRGRFFMSETNKSQKSRINAQINNAGIMAVRTMRSGLMAGVASPARPWFRLATPDPEMMKYREVKEYLEIVEKLMRDIFSGSNLYQALPNVFGELGTFGTACAVIMPDFNDVIRIFQPTLGQYCLATDENNITDTMSREIMLTSKQAVQRFGYENLSTTVQGAFNQGNYQTQFLFVHMIEPNPVVKSDSFMGKDKAWRSVYFEQGRDDMAEVTRMSGFDSFNVMAPRWETTGEDVYGYGCGFYALGDDKQLQLQEKRKAQAVDKMLSPPLKAPASMKNKAIVGIPAGVTYYDSTAPGQDGLSPLYEVRPDISHLSQDMERVEKRISRAFYEDLFLMLAQSDRRQITAREVDERVEEKLLMLGPAMEAMHSELLSPLIANTYKEMVKNNLLPPAPEVLQGKALKVEFISTMAQAQKMVGIGSIERYIGFVGQVGQLFPEARHKLDAIQAVDTVGNMLGVPQNLIRSDDDVKERQDADAAAASSQNAVSASMAGASVAETLSKATTSRGNLLETLAGV